jgi:hypothetical protein
MAEPDRDRDVVDGALENELLGQQHKGVFLSGLGDPLHQQWDEKSVSDRGKGAGLSLAMVAAEQFEDVVPPCSHSHLTSSTD